MIERRIKGCEPIVHCEATHAIFWSYIKPGGPSGDEKRSHSYCKPHKVEEDEMLNFSIPTTTYP